MQQAKQEFSIDGVTLSVGLVSILLSWYHFGNVNRLKMS